MIKIIILFYLIFSAQAFAADQFEIKSVGDIKKCGQQNSWDTGYCFEPFEKFVSKNPSQALAAAKAGRTVFAQWVVLPTFEKAYLKSKDITICKDEDFQISLFNSLGQDSENESYKIAQKFLKGECGPFLVEMATKELDQYAGSAVIENLCPLLKANGKTHKNCEPKVATPEPQRPKETLPKLEKSKIKLGLIKAYQGPEGIKVFIAEVVGQKNTYLIKFSGIKGPWNNKTLIHKTNQVGTDGSMDYWTDYNGSDWNSVVVGQCYRGYCRTDMFAPLTGNNGGVALTYDESETKKIKSKDLINSL